MQPQLTTLMMLDQLNRYALFQELLPLSFAARHQGWPNLFQLYGASDLVE
jgi:hypothetical protein